jgi:hypothetical protein
MRLAGLAIICNMKLTPEKLTAFCAALAETGIVARACKAVDITRETAYKWRRLDPAFAKDWDAALEIGITALEDEAHRRAFEGAGETIYHLGKAVGETKKYSDTLAIFLLKAHRPERYRERAEVEHKGGVSINVVTGVPGPESDIDDIA